VTESFVFDRHENIGAAAAEDDGAFLLGSFFDSGDVGVLKDTDNNKSIVVGRTGAGKTALLIKLEETEKSSVTWLNPESLSLQYLSNSKIIQYLTELGVNLDLFYKLLWKHTIAVELVRVRYDIKDKKDSERWVDRILSHFERDKKKKDAIEYVSSWGGKFWEDTHERLKEVTKSLEKQLEGKLGGGYEQFDMSVGGSLNLTEIEKKDVIDNSQRIVNSIQIDKLNTLWGILSEEFCDNNQKSTYVLIDKLDDNWVDDSIRYRLIRALIETVRDVSNIKNAKLIITLRRDLLDRVFRKTRGPGFQEEKYRSFYLTINWSKSELLNILNNRINHLVKRKYTKKIITYQDLLPNTINSESIEDFLVSRTMYRPRDIVEFFNCCIELAHGKKEINSDLLRKAEAEYSTRRFRSLADEWYSDYPEILEYTKLLNKTKKTFRIDSLDEKKLEDFALAVGMADIKHTTELFKLSHKALNGDINIVDFRDEIINIFYRLGVVGLKTQSTATCSWVFKAGSPVPRAEISNDTKVSICPIFYRVLGTVVV
jgi:hypothetical protein